MGKADGPFQVLLLQVPQLLVLGLLGKGKAGVERAETTNVAVVFTAVLKRLPTSIHSQG